MATVRMLSVGGHAGGKRGGMAEMKGGRFHIKVISVLKKQSWRLKMFCHGCEGMHGITRRDLFFFFPPSCYGISRGDGEEWEHFFFFAPTSASI